MKIVEIEIVSLIVAVATGLVYLIKISLQVKDYFEKIERVILEIKQDLTANYDEQINSLFQVKKQVNYLHINLSKLFPDTFTRPDFMDF